MIPIFYSLVDDLFQRFICIYKIGNISCLLRVFSTDACAFFDILNTSLRVAFGEFELLVDQGYHMLLLFQIELLL